MDKVRSAKKRRHAADSTSRFKKYVAAGAAVVGAGAIAVNPTAPVVETKADVKTESYDVALTAAANPVSVWEQTFAETQLNLALLGINASNSSNALNAALQNADLLGELMDIVRLNLTDPAHLINRVLNFHATYGDDLQIGLFGRDDDPSTTANEAFAGVFERVGSAINGIAPLIQDLMNYDPPAPLAGQPAQGPITNIAFELNNYFVLSLLNALRPLSTATPAGVIPLLSIPGDILGGLPGFNRIDDLINSFGEQGAARAFVGPFLTAGFQLAQVLDDTLAAAQAGDAALAVNELVNLPARVVNAFVNGFTPVFSPGEWPSLLSGATLLTGSNTAPGGFQYTLVTAVNDIIRALGGTPPTLVTELPDTTSGDNISPLTAGDETAADEPAAGETPAEDTTVEEQAKSPAAPETAEVTEPAAELVSSTTDEATEEGTEDGTEAATPAETKTPASTRPTSTWGTTTPKDVFKKVHSDIEKTVSGIFGRKTESTKAEPTTTAGTDNAGTTGGGSTDGSATETDKSEGSDDSNDKNDSE